MDFLGLLGSFNNKNHICSLFGHSKDVLIINSGIYLLLVSAL